MPQTVRLRLVYALCLLTAIGCGQKNDQNSDRYSLAENWPRLQSKEILGQPSGLGIDSKGNLVIFHRAGADPDAAAQSKIPENTIAKLDADTGKILESWGKDLFGWPHGLTIDYNDNVWVTDVGLHQIFKFSPEGELLMKLGEERKPGDDQRHFNRPTDVAIAEDGSFYVSDGYGNSRIIKFSSSGKFLFQWGEKGNGKGQFDLPHAVDLDGEGNVVVADRENGRIQKFDAKGNFLREWSNEGGGKVYSIKTDPVNRSIWAVDYLVGDDDQILGSDILRFGTELEFEAKFGRSKAYEGPVCRYHDIEMDNHQNIFVADLLENRVQKFSPVQKK